MLHEALADTPIVRCAGKWNAVELRTHQPCPGSERWRDDRESRARGFRHPHRRLHARLARPGESPWCQGRGGDDPGLGSAWLGIRHRAPKARCAPVAAHGPTTMLPGPRAVSRFPQTDARGSLTCSTLWDSLLSRADDCADTETTVCACTCRPSDLGDWHPRSERGGRRGREPGPWSLRRTPVKDVFVPGATERPSNWWIVRLAELPILPMSISSASLSS